MPFTVTYKDAGIKRHEFDAYVRLLEKRGIDWTNIPRVPEPGTPNKWLYVWASANEAESFCDELKKETGDDKWIVRELGPDVHPSEGALTPVVILMRRQSLGAEFTLHPHSRTLVRRRFPNANLVSSVSIELPTMQEFEQQHGPIWSHIAMVLSGLNSHQLSELGGFRVVDPGRNETVVEDALVNVE